ncbi:hypothetical protein EV360DRAFT_66949 [Lentinula raphanica]|nr:hypothetical protein EV360DRAFT_66949 [Lentinula raphanica]
MPAPMPASHRLAILSYCCFTPFNLRGKERKFEQSTQREVGKRKSQQLEITTSLIMQFNEELGWICAERVEVQHTIDSESGLGSIVNRDSYCAVKVRDAITWQALLIHRIPLQLDPYTTPTVQCLNDVGFPLHFAYFLGIFSMGKKLCQPGIAIVQFPSESARNTAPPIQRHHRHIFFAQGFSPEFRADNLFTTLIIVEGRRYVVSGTYNQCMEGSNEAVNGLGCNAVFKGDVGICFLGKIQRNRFLEGLPCFVNEEEKQRVLRKVLQIFTRNVINHVERHRRLSHVISG